MAWLALGVIVALSLAGCSSSIANNLPVPTATPGQITLTPDRSAYTPSQPFGITLKNNAKTTFYAYDGRTGCTFLELQEFVATKGAWTPVNLCTTGDPPQVFAISGSASEPFTLAPGNASGDPNSWQDGTYRVVLTYNTQQDGTGTRQTIYSQGFMVQG
jgi:hypothetical protein